jgi:hypothetical protein
MRRIGGNRQDVPYMSREDIEAEAALVLAEFGQTHDVAAPPIPVDDIVELHLGLTFELKDMHQLFGVGDVHGALWMDEALVGVDQSLDPKLFPAKLGRFRFTLAHEAGHWRLHKKYYMKDPSQAALFGELGKPAYICRSSEARKPVEWQADFFAANLLMPRPMMVSAWEGWRGDPKPVALPDICDPAVAKANGCGDDEVMEAFAEPLAQKFQVSGPAMRIRLEELGLLLRQRESTLF